MLNIKQEEFDCPEISFVSGLTEHATDNARAILSYGINDCTSRVVLIDKSEISRYLFNGLE